MADADSKVCRVCGHALHLESFHINKQNKDGRSGACKSCANRLSGERYHRTKVLRPLSLTQMCAHCGKEFLRPQPSRPGDPPRSSTKHCSIECRFWSKVDSSAGPDACWPWLAKARAQSGEGYGNFAIRNGKYVHAHRFAWQLTNGPIPSGLQGCHKCDNPLCCNPRHLFLGTHQDNMDDMHAKGRNWNMSMNPELIERLREMKIGKPKSEGTREKIRQTLLGRPTGRRGRPNGQKGTPKPKQSEAMRAYWARRKAAGVAH
jgi:hypothetical protein